MPWYIQFNVHPRFAQTHYLVEPMMWTYLGPLDGSFMIEHSQVWVN